MENVQSLYTKSYILKIVEDTINQLETNATKCLDENDKEHSEMYSRMASGARCVKQNLEYDLV